MKTKLSQETKNAIKTVKKINLKTLREYASREFYLNFKDRGNDYSYDYNCGQYGIKLGPEVIGSGEWTKCGIIESLIKNDLFYQGHI